MSKTSSRTFLCLRTGYHAWLGLLLCAGHLWQQTEAVTSQILAVAVPKVVKTPGFPAPYPFGTVVIAVVEPSPGHEDLQVLINGTDLPPRDQDGNCQSERLLLFDMTPNKNPSFQLCGNETLTMKSAEKVMIIFYARQNNTRYSGFQIYIFAEQIFQEDLTIGLYFLFLAVSLAALIAFCKRQLKDVRLKESDIPKVVHILPISKVRGSVVASGSYYTFQDDMAVRPVEPNSVAFRRFVRRASYGRRVSITIREPIRIREDEYCPMGGRSPDADGTVPAREYVLKEARYREVPPAEDDDPGLPQILLTPEPRVVGAWLPFVRAKVAQKEKAREQMVQCLRPSMQLYYHSIVDTEQKHPLPPDFSVKPIYVGDGVISGLAQVELGNKLTLEKKKWKGNGDEPPWVHSRGIAEKVMASHHLTNARRLALNCPCLPKAFRKTYSGETSLPGDSLKQQLAHALSEDVRCISEERSLRPYWADPAKNLLEEPPPSLPPQGETKPDVATVQKEKKQGGPRPRQVKHPRKGYRGPAKVSPQTKPPPSPRAVKAGKPMTKSPPAVKAGKPMTKSPPAVKAGKPMAKSPPAVKAGKPMTKSPPAVKAGKPMTKSPPAVKVTHPATKTPKTAQKLQAALKSPPTANTAESSEVSPPVDARNSATKSRPAIKVTSPAAETPPAVRTGIPASPPARRTGQPAAKSSPATKTGQPAVKSPPAARTGQPAVKSPHAARTGQPALKSPPAAKTGQPAAKSPLTLEQPQTTAKSPEAYETDGSSHNASVDDSKRTAASPSGNTSQNCTSVPASPESQSARTETPSNNLSWVPGNVPNLHKYTTPRLEPWVSGEPTQTHKTDGLHLEPCDSENLVRNSAEEFTENNPLFELQRAEQGCTVHTVGKDRDESGWPTL